jgi:hypothetical protein
MIKLLVISDLSVRGVTVPRLYSLERLAENGYPVTVIVRNKFPSTYDLEWCDVVFILRAININDLNFIKKAKSLNKKVWIDSDDDLFNVPIDHCNYFENQNAELRRAYVEIHCMADAVSYSTKELLASHSKWSKNNFLIPCAYPDERVVRFKESDLPQKKIVYWRGTATHEKSLLEYAPYIVSLAKKNPDWEFHFSGFKPWYILEKIKNNWKTYGFFDVDDLLEHIHGLRPAINMIVRTDNPFTKSRSCISYMETTFGGAVTVAPNWEEWIKPGIVNYKDKKDFIVQMEKTMDQFNKTPNKKRVKKAFEYIEKNMVWSKVNKLQYQVLKSLTKK